MSYSDEMRAHAEITQLRAELERRRALKLCDPLYCTYGNHILSAEVAENARLRAREAELMAVLREVERWIETKPVVHPYDTWQKIRAALAKVEGT